MLEERATIINDIEFYKLQNDPFQINGSIVDFGMKEGEIPHFPYNKAIYRTDEFGDIAGGLGIVGADYPLTTHREFFTRQHDMLMAKFPAKHLENITAKYKTSLGGAWALQDISFNDIKFPLGNEHHKTELGLRSVSWHSVNGSASNNALFGAIDFFCTNGMITGEYDVVKKKNTKHFDMRKFVDEIEKSVEEFYDTVKKYQAWANRKITFEDAKNVIEFLPVADRNKPKLLTIYEIERDTRGGNLWALYSAFTNYSSHTDNGFAVRQTKHDHEAKSMLEREFKVAQWVDSEEFVRLAA